MPRRDIGWFDRSRAAFRLADAGKFREAEQKQKQALKRARKKDGMDLLYALQTTGFFYWHNGRIEKAIAVFDECLQAANASELSGASEYAENAATGLGMCFTTKKDSARARDYYKQALSLAKKSGEVRKLADLHVMLGATSVQLNDFKSAIRYYEEAIATNELKDDARRTVEELLVMAYGSRKKFAKRDAIRKKLIAEDIAGFLKKTQTTPKPKSMDLPSGYGRDSVSDFLYEAELNTLATFELDKKRFRALTEREAHFRVMHSAVRNFLAAKLVANYPNENVEEMKPSDEDWIESYFFQQCHSSFLGAIRLAASGQIPQAQMVFRGCLENAMYAYLIFRRPQDKAVWFNRASDPDAVRNRFTPTKIWAVMQHFDPDLRARMEPLYDRTIEEGAHPNVSAMKRHAYQQKRWKQIHFTLNYLNPKEIHGAIDELLELVDCALAAFDLIFDSVAP